MPRRRSVVVYASQPWRYHRAVPPHRGFQSTADRETIADIAAAFTGAAANLHNEHRVDAHAASVLVPEWSVTALRSDRQLPDTSRRATLVSKHTAISPGSLPPNGRDSITTFRASDENVFMFFVRSVFHRDENVCKATLRPTARRRPGARERPRLCRGRWVASGV